MDLPHRRHRFCRRRRGDFLPASGLSTYAAKWLKPDEIRFLELSHRSTRGVVSKEAKKGFQWKVVWSILTDWQLYLQCLIFMSNSVPNYGLKFTMPQIMRNMGFESTNAQLLTARESLPLLPSPSRPRN